jgi:UTP-glucose-1-phosphate uridylyltransferase
MNPTLIIMAAGESSRYGKLKQFEKVGKQSAFLLEFGIYDAIKAGFNQVLFIIQKEYEKHLANLSKSIKDKIKVGYVIQEIKNIPKEYSILNRQKQWGTAHAIWCCRNKVTGPFAIINADDFYGYSSYKILYDNLKKGEKSYYMVGYKLENTLSENGSVNRGICIFDSENYLKDIKEEIDISNFSKYDKDTIVSMNMWGFQENFMHYLDKELKVFLNKNINKKNNEFFIPIIVDKLIKSGVEKVKVLQSNEKWVGMSYKEDKSVVEKEIEKRDYPKNLWKKS